MRIILTDRRPTESWSGIFRYVNGCGGVFKIYSDGSITGIVFAYKQCNIGYGCGNADDYAHEWVCRNASGIGCGLQANVWGKWDEILKTYQWFTRENNNDSGKGPQKGGDFDGESQRAGARNEEVQGCCCGNAEKAAAHAYVAVVCWMRRTKGRMIFTPFIY